MITTIKIKTTGLSLLELRDKYSNLFYPQEWYKDENFAKEKPEAGEFEIVVDRVLTGMTFKEQKESLKKDEIILHAAQYLEGIINQFDLTGERLFEDWYIRTNTLDSGGGRVYVGDFDSDGLNVGDYWGDDRSDGIGLSSARKVDSETKIEVARYTPDIIEINGSKYKKI